MTGATVERRPTDVERAEVLKAVAHPVRLQLLRELARDEECVCHLAHLLRRPQPYVSKQLAALREAGVVIDRRDAQRVFYRLTGPEMVNLVRAVCGEEESHSEESGSRAGCPCPKCD